MEHDDLWPIWDALPDTASIPGAPAEAGLTLSASWFMTNVGNGFSHRLAWHPAKPVLCTADDPAWWSVDGTPYVRFTRGIGAWQGRGDWFFTQDWGNHGWMFYHRPTHTESALSVPYWADIHSWNPTAPLLLIATRPASTPPQLQIWDCQQRQPLLLQRSDGGSVSRARWSPDGAWVVGLVAPENAPARIMVWDREGTVSAELPLPSATSIRGTHEHGVIWDPTGSIIVVHLESMILWWNWRQEEPRWIALENGHLHGFKALEWSHDGSRLAVLTYDAIVLLDRAGNVLSRLPSSDGAWVSTMIWHPRQPCLWMGSWDATLSRWSPDGDRLGVFSLATHSSLAPRVPFQIPYYSAYDATGTWLAVSTRSYIVHILHDS